MNGKEVLQDFFVMNLGKDRLLLGWPWFLKFNPQINWAEMKVLRKVNLKMPEEHAIIKKHRVTLKQVVLQYGLTDCLIVTMCFTSFTRTAT